jgi:hypothetical protein
VAALKSWTVDVFAALTTKIPFRGCVFFSRVVRVISFSPSRWSLRGVLRYACCFTVGHSERVRNGTLRCNFEHLLLFLSENGQQRKDRTSIAFTGSLFQHVHPLLIVLQVVT